MSKARLGVIAAAYAICLCGQAPGALPPPPTELADWSIPWEAQVPGVFAADDLLDKPAGRNGPVVARDGHFFTGSRRIRFWGVNICFGGCFPTHEQADAIARRLSRFGVNCVRFHHMDMQPFPGGIFADAKLEKLSPEAMDRLDYFIAALKKEGVYSNLNLHVSRTWSKAHGWENADKLREFDKIVDLFEPRLIEAQKQYARDLLTHVNTYTKNRYAHEPAVAMVEINNEDSLFMWGSEEFLANMPQPYMSTWHGLWNQWLLKRYGTRQKLADAWSDGAQKAGDNLLLDGEFQTLDKPDRRWNIEMHNGAKMTVTSEDAGGRASARLSIQTITNQVWNLQFGQNCAIARDRFYTVRFRAKSDKPALIDLGVSMAHAPWDNLGLATSARLTDQWQEFTYGFAASAGDENARIAFSVGRQVGTVWFGDIQIRPGGRAGLRDDEDPAKNTVARGARGAAVTQARSDDWYRFMQQTDEGYFVEMRRFLREDLGVKCPITGTIGFGPLGIKGQSKMDFVDGHSYWDHPSFPRRPWDSKDWLIRNKPMVDSPDRSTLGPLAMTRVRDLPYTVTEYNHSAPNEWQAECIPLIATQAALQDWDGVFLFAYTHNSRYEKTKMDSFFDIEGNPLKMAMMPMAARVFLGTGVAPARGAYWVPADEMRMLRRSPALRHNVWEFAREQMGGGNAWADRPLRRVGLTFTRWLPSSTPAPTPRDGRASWTANGPGTGRASFSDEFAAMFVGFAPDGPVDLGAMRIEKLDTPFAAVMAVPADPVKGLADADRVLLCAVARGANADMKWNTDRTSVSDQWGSGPCRIEVVRATLSFSSPRPVRVFPLDGRGQRQPTPLPVEKRPDGRYEFQIGPSPTAWYELAR
jgi:hypothetical protein